LERIAVFIAGFIHVRSGGVDAGPSSCRFGQSVDNVVPVPIPQGLATIRTGCCVRAMRLYLADLFSAILSKYASVLKGKSDLPP
jgi:hypothetical protein